LYPLKIVVASLSVATTHHTTKWDAPSIPPWILNFHFANLSYAAAHVHCKQKNSTLANKGGRFSQ
jgi:hypothetical protein